MKTEMQNGPLPDEVRAVRRVTFEGMAVNVAVAALKGAAGVLASSQALVADAVHSLSDLATDFAVVFGVKFWTAPADEDHPYGHGKIQAVVTLFIGAILLLVAWELGTKAVSDLRTPVKATPGHFALFVALVSIASKEILYRWTKSVAKRVNSPALAANAWHHRSDALSSIPVAIAVGVAHFFPNVGWVDTVGALVVSLFIVRVAWSILSPALSELVDSGAKEKTTVVYEIASAVEGVRTVHKVRAHRSGGGFHVDLHVKVDPCLTVAEGHSLGHAVQRAILSAGIEVTDAIIHVEPYFDAPSRPADLV